MKISSLLIGVAAAVAGMAAQAGTTDVAQYGKGYFVDSDANKYSSPYYRYYSGDWGWTHNAIAGPFSSASVQVSAFDVDYDGTANGESDLIYAYDGGVGGAGWTLLGHLDGHNDQWAYTTFNLGSNFFDDIAAGLQMKIDIDSSHTSDFWAVTLAKSSLSVDGGGIIPGPVPGVPEPETYAMMVAGLGILGAISRRRKAAGK